jgi:hypothetical protein
VGKLLCFSTATAILLGLVGTASGTTVDAATPCTGAMLTGTFKVIPGSAGAGNIVYRLRIASNGQAACFVTGLPGVTLLDAHGRKLPTKYLFAGQPGTLTAVMVQLAPGSGAATLTARFSPDIPGPGEPVSGRRCEPTAYKLRVAPSGGGSVVVPISPPTPVCEHGTLQLTSFVRG